MNGLDPSVVAVYLVWPRYDTAMATYAGVMALVGAGISAMGG